MIGGSLDQGDFLQHVFFFAIENNNLLEDVRSWSAGCIEMIICLEQCHRGHGRLSLNLGGHGRLRVSAVLEPKTEVPKMPQEDPRLRFPRGIKGA